MWWKGTPAIWEPCRSEDNLRESILSFNQVVSGIELRLSTLTVTWFIIWATYCLNKIIYCFNNQWKISNALSMTAKYDVKNTANSLNLALYTMEKNPNICCVHDLICMKNKRRCEKVLANCSMQHRVGRALMTSVYFFCFCFQNPACSPRISEYFPYCVLQSVL